MASAPTRLSQTTLETFGRLVADAPRDERWELVRGRIVRMMVDARWEHNRIINNIGYELRRRFDERGSPCRVFLETFRLRSAPTESSLLPDVIVHCEPLAPGATSLERPVALAEVASDSTSPRDRREKLEVYRTLPSLRHYLLVRPDTAHVEVLDNGDGFRTPRVVQGLDHDVALRALEMTLPLRSIYRDVLG